MRKKTTRFILTLTALLTLTAGAFWNSEPDITMLVVPRRPEPIRIARDFAELRPVLLVTYQTVDEDLLIHAWNGKSWVSVTPEAYVDGAFFTKPPAHTILVQSKDNPAPELLVPDGIWCDSGNRLTSTEPRVMLHLLGRYFDISYNDWKDFTWRYQLPLESINPGLVNIPWWHFQGEDLYRARMKRNLAADLENWYVLGIEPPPPIEPVDLEPDPEIAPAELPASEAVEEEPAADESELTPAYLLDPNETNSVVSEPVEMPEPEQPAGTEEPGEKKAIVNEVVIDADPFTETEIPAAEIVLPKEPEQPAEEKKAWWKIF